MINKKKKNNQYIHPTSNINFNFSIRKDIKNNKIPSKIKVMSNVIIYKGCRLGEDIFIGHNAIIRHCSNIGNHTKIGSNSEISFNVKIGSSTTVHSNCFVCENTIIGKGCFVGPNVNFLNSKYPYQENSKRNLKSAKISDNVIIGSGSIIMPGIKIGKNVLIGAGTLVNSDIKPNSVVYSKTDLKIKKK